MVADCHRFLPATHTRTISAFTPQPQRVTALWLVLLRPPTKGWPGWVYQGGWLYAKINAPHRELNAVTVTDHSTNGGWRVAMEGMDLQHRGRVDGEWMEGRRQWTVTLTHWSHFDFDHYVGLRRYAKSVTPIVRPTAKQRLQAYKRHDLSGTQARAWTHLVLIKAI